MTRARQLVSLIVALVFSIAIVIGAFKGLRVEAMVVLAWCSVTLLGKRGVLESIIVGLKRVEKIGKGRKRIKMVDMSRIRKK